MSKLPFNSITIDGQTFGPDKFVAGSGSIEEKGSDKAVILADGHIMNIREAVNWQCTCELYNDQTDLNGAIGTGIPVSVSYGATALRSGTGIVTASYNESSYTTSVTIQGDPE